MITDYQNYIAISRYARYLEDEQRRETWGETVDRYMEFMKTHLETNYNYTIPKTLYKELRTYVFDLNVMPSMRTIMTAGPALLRDNICAYNCAYSPVDHPRAFDETLYILMCGTGVGFSVERQYINKLPEVSEHFENSESIIKVADSKSGWARSFKELISMLYSGQVPKWDLSALRPSGARLKTFGGRSSGPAPLDDLFKFTVEKFKGAKGRKLTSIECHDIMCKVGQVVVVGGVRRSAMISLSNLTDDRMRHAKSGQWGESNKQRALANNSVCYTEKPDMGAFMREWEALYDSKSGERGIFNRQAAVKTVEKIGRRESNHDFGTNPCSEIILRPQQFCNLSEVVARHDDTMEDLLNKVRLATIFGTFQSTLTDFKYLRKIWKNNTEEERLLGVSITGIMDHPVLNGTCNMNLNEFFGHSNWSGYTYLQDTLTELKEKAIETNKIFAKKLGIPQSTAITCVKPSGTVSQLVDSSSGIHPRYSKYYIRTVRGDIKDPMTQFLMSQGVPYEPAIGQENNMIVFSFPHKSPTPEGSSECITRDDVSAPDQLNLWLIYQIYWCEHKPSITVYVREDEWMEVGAFVYKHFDGMSGVSFLPYDNGSYQQAPYQEITKEQYEEAVKAMPSINWKDFKEEEDNTTSSQELACSGGVCEIVDLT